MTFTFKQSGAKLTGAIDGPMGDPMDIKDGKVDGDRISFAIVMDRGGDSMKIIHEGTIKSDDEITLTVKMPAGGPGGPGGPGGGGPGGPGGPGGGPRPMTLKRAK